MEQRVENVLITREEINQKVKKIGQIISEDYKGREIYVLSLLRGSFIFAADLVREINLQTRIGFMTTSSYGNEEVSAGSVKIINDIPDKISGLDVLIVDDIIDTGITMDFVYKHVKALGASSIKICTLLDKPDRRLANIHPDYCCFKIPDVFVVGYGLNFGDYYRNVPFIFNWK
jgi:hypoxanthine phosphoribosyltransferase